MYFLNEPFVNQPIVMVIVLVIFRVHPKKMLPIFSSQFLLGTQSSFY